MVCTHRKNSSFEETYSLKGRETVSCMADPQNGLTKEQVQKYREAGFCCYV